MIEVVYYQPEHFALAGLYQPCHKLEVREDELCVGYADLVYRKKPFPHFYVDFIEVKPTFRGLGYGKVLVNSCNQFIRDNKKAGLLYDGIDEKSPAYGIYEKHGWTKLPSRPRWYALDVPEYVPQEKIITAIHIANNSLLRS